MRLDNDSTSIRALDLLNLSWSRYIAISYSDTVQEKTVVVSKEDNHPIGPNIAVICSATASILVTLFTICDVLRASQSQEV